MDSSDQKKWPLPSSRALDHVPASWFHLCHCDQLKTRPVGISLGGRSYVGFRTGAGKAVVLSGRCSHMGADLSQGKVLGDRLVCPLHGWEYRVDGHCEKIPSTGKIPAFARQCSYPTEEYGGHVFFFNRAQSRFPMPFFEGVSPADLFPAKPFELFAETPWFFIGANGFDIQHFRMAHDRTLLEPPVITEATPFGRRVVLRLGVSGKSINDKLTRWIAGPTVTMDVTSWCGTIILVKARFQRTTTYGIFNVLPVDTARTLGRVIVWVKRSQSAPARMLFDPWNAAVRRLFIRTFLRSDLPRIAGLRYRPGSLIDADGPLADYFAWLERVSEPVTTENL